MPAACPHKADHFIHHNFNHQLSWFNRLQYIVCTQSFVLHLIGKIFGYGIVNIGINQSASNFFDGLGNIYFRKFGIAFSILSAPSNFSLKLSNIVIRFRYTCLAFHRAALRVRKYINPSK